MLVFSTIWALCCVSTQTAMCSLAKGSSTGGDPQGNGLTTAPSFRKLLEDAQPFIVRGKDAPKGRFPYACSLKALGSRIHGCGGTLIAPGWVLTAAHCLIGKDSLGPTPVVHVGAFKIDDYSSEEVILAEEAIIHESYTRGNVEDGFDVALLRLKKPFNIQPAAVAQSNQRLVEGQLLATAGWGRKVNRGEFPKKLQLADQVAYVSNKNCQQQWPNLKDSMLCAFSNSQAVCDGDSGGPLLIADSKGGGNITSGDPALDLLVGIVSFGEKCDSTKPDVYTRVSSFQEWMDEKMRESPPQTTPMEKCGRDCDKLDEDLFNAAGSGEANKVKELISKGADVSSSQGELEYTPLHFAAEMGHVDVVEILIEAGANVDVQDGEGITALYVAAFTGNLDVVKFLVKAGATVDLKGDKGFTPLIIAAEQNKLDVAQFLLESGANIDARNGQGLTPLFVAAQKGNLDVVKFLVKAGATVDLKRDIGGTPLMVAAQANNLEVAKFLLESGANIDAQTDDGATALYLAAQNGHLDVVKLLVGGGATVDLKRDIGATPLIVAAQANNLEVAEFLVESGADVNARSSVDETPLHSAASAGNPKLIRLLLDNGAEIEARDYLEQTPVFWAAMYGSGEAIEVLKTAGADLSIKNKNGAKIEDAICRCLEFSPPTLVCREGTCGEGEKERIQAILKR